MAAGARGVVRAIVEGPRYRLAVPASCVPTHDGDGNGCDFACDDGVSMGIVTIRMIRETECLRTKRTMRRMTEWCTVHGAQCPWWCTVNSAWC